MICNEYDLLCLFKELKELYIIENIEVQTHLEILKNLILIITLEWIITFSTSFNNHK